MSTAVGLKSALFAGGVPSAISPHSPLYDRAEAMPGRRGPAADRAISYDSSIGRNSDCSSAGVEGEGDSGEAEVQSALKGPLDSMDMLDLSLPTSSGISSFYRGKSKSCTHLQDGSPWSSPEDLSAKPEGTSSNRKRKKRQPLLFTDGLDSKDIPRSHDRLTKRLADVNYIMPTLGTVGPASKTAASSSSGSNSSGATSSDEDQDTISSS